MRIVYLAPYSEDTLMAYPSNYAYYIKELKEIEDFELYVINSSNYKGNFFQKTLALCKEINRIKPDVLYLTLWMGYNNLVLAKILKVIKCKIVIWKFTNCIDSKNLLLHLFYKYVYWANIDMIYMQFGTHTENALSTKIVDKAKIKTLSRGADISWYRAFKIDNDAVDFKIIATGQDSRDYQTLIKACIETNTICKIITRGYPENIELQNEYKDSDLITVEIMKDGFTINEYKYIMQEVGKYSALAICCHRRLYGVGYTNIVENLSFEMPIIQTRNKDVHIDPEKAGIGISVEPYDINGWISAITKLKSDKIFVEDCKTHIRDLLKYEYNSIETTRVIANDFRKICGR